MPTISQALAIAFEHHRAGRLELAEQICHRILAADPDQADVLHLVGVLAQQTGRHEIAAKYIARAVELNPTDAGFYNNLGAAYKDWGRLDDAIRCYRRAIALRPELAEAHYNLGNALMEEGEQGEAVQCYYRALERKPAYADALNNLGNALKDGGDLAGAAALYRRALEAKPDYAEALNNLGASSRQLGNLDEAVACFRNLLALRPDSADACFNLGNVLNEQRRLAEAAVCYRRAVELRPGFVDAHGNLGVVLQEQGRLEDAVQCFRRALELEPDNATTFNNLGNALLGQGDQHAAMACYRQALRRERGHAGALQNCVCGLRYVPDATAEELLAAAVDYDRQHAARFRTLWPRHANPAIADRRLRLGFVSPAFHEAPMRAFLPSSLEHVAPAQCELAFYSTTPGGVVPGGLRLQDFGALWHDASRWSDDQLAGQIRADQIDILFDLAGHAPGNRLLVFARKPAPVQITWIDSVGTTGLSAIDYLLADRWLIPAGAEANFAERVLRMPAGYVCYGPPENSPPVGPLAALGKGHVTFGSFSRPAKIHARVIRAWSAILHRTPRSRLVLKHAGFADRGTSGRFRQLFEAEGVEFDRIELQGYSSPGDYFDQLQAIDVSLDPFPHGGGLTACDSLWMGVPVVTCPGETFAGRQAFGHLSNVGLGETIARDLDQYVEIAVRLAGDLPRLAELRAGLRERVARSALCDRPRFAADLTRLLREVWREWCSTRQDG